MDKTVKSAIIAGVFLIIATIITGIFYLFSDGESENVARDNGMAVSHSGTGDQYATQHGDINVTVIYEKMYEIWEKLNSELLRKYPLGCLLYGVTAKNKILPYDNKLETIMDIDWDSAQVLHVTDKIIRIQLNNVRHRKSNNTLHLKWDLVKTPGFKNEVALINDVHVFVEYLGDSQDGGIGLVGFREAD